MTCCRGRYSKPSPLFGTLWPVKKVRSRRYYLLCVEYGSLEIHNNHTLFYLGHLCLRHLPPKSPMDSSLRRKHGWL